MLRPKRISKPALRWAAPMLAAAWFAAAPAHAGHTTSTRAGCRRGQRPRRRVDRDDAGPYTYAEDTCSQPAGGLLAALGDQPARTANTDIATWSFGAPPGATIATGDALARRDAEVVPRSTRPTSSGWQVRRSNVREQSLTAVRSVVACPAGKGIQSTPLRPKMLSMSRLPNLGQSDILRQRLVRRSSWIACKQGLVTQATTLRPSTSTRPISRLNRMRVPRRPASPANSRVRRW